jgi:hypothetical protein
LNIHRWTWGLVEAHLEGQEWPMYGLDRASYRRTCPPHGRQKVCPRAHVAISGNGSSNGGAVRGGAGGRWYRTMRSHAACGQGCDTGEGKEGRGAGATCERGNDKRRTWREGAQRGIRQP